MQNQANLVTPGAIWARTDAKSQGRRSTILLVANQHLKGRLADEFPPMVTYQDDKGNINTVSEDRFTSNREFWDMDDTVMYKVRALLSQDDDESEDLDEDEEDDGLSLVEDGGLSTTSTKNQAVSIEVLKRPNAPEVVNFDDEEETTVEASVAVLAQAQPAQEPVEVTQQDVEQIPHPSLAAVFISNNPAYPELDPELLENSVIQYEQEPMLTDDGLGLRHKVLVFMGQGLDIDALNNAFDPEKTNYYSSFKINTIVVNWDSYLGAWPVLASDGVYASLVFTTAPQRTTESVGEADTVAEEQEEATPVVTPASVEQPAPVVTQPVEVVQTPAPVQLNVQQGMVIQAQPAVTPITGGLDIVGDTALNVQAASLVVTPA